MEHRHEARVACQVRVESERTLPAGFERACEPSVGFVGEEPAGRPQGDGRGAGNRGQNRAGDEAA